MYIYGSLPVFEPNAIVRLLYSDAFLESQIIPVTFFLSIPTIVNGIYNYY